MFDYTYFTSDIPVNNCLYNYTTNIVSFSIENITQSTNIKFKDNYNLTVTMAGGGGGGGSSGAGGGTEQSYQSGGGGGGAGFGKFLFNAIANTEYTYTIGSGGIGGTGATATNYIQCSGSSGTNTIFDTSYGIITATGGDGGQGYMYNGLVIGGNNGIFTDPSNITTIIVNGNGGNGGNGFNNDSGEDLGLGTNGDNSTPQYSIEVIPSNIINIGGGGGGVRCFFK